MMAIPITTIPIMITPTRVIPIMTTPITIMGPVTITPITRTNTPITRTNTITGTTTNHGRDGTLPNDLP